MTKDILKTFRNIDLNDFEIAFNNYYKDFPIVIVKPGEPLLKKESHFDESFEVFIEKFVEIFKQAALELKLKEDVDIFTSISEEIVPKVSIKTLTTEMVISFGLMRDYYIITRLENVNFLNQMKDDFWLLLTELQNYGKLLYREEPKPSKSLKTKYPQLFKKQGQIYKFSRNYFLSQIEYGRCNSLGYLEIRWDRDIPIKDTINNFIETFKILYKLNYLLWLEMQKNKNK